ncbi:MAG: hypothetical protein LBE09_04115, partial [Christensenellaceae bacterium]|nr:hypothetical protein [Christensenellaceae bacterium]
GSSDNYFYEEGTFKITITDSVGNTLSKTFTIDYTPPKIEIEKSIYGASDILTLTLTEQNLRTFTLDGAAISASYSIPVSTLTSSTHDLIATDMAGNSHTISFTVDLEAPALSLTNGFYYKAGDKLTLNVRETYSYTVVLNGKTLTSSQWINVLVDPLNFTDGAYSFVVTDAAGNSSDISFYVDFAPPQLSLDKIYFAEADDIELSIMESTPFTLTLDTTTTLSKTVKASTLTDGKHTFKATDSAGNSSTVDFYVDTLAPTLSLKDFYQPGESVSFNIADASPCSFHLNGLSFDSSYQLCTTDENLFGYYTAIVVDMAGNETRKMFFYGAAAPSVVFYKEGIVAGTYIYLRADEIATLHVTGLLISNDDTLMNGQAIVLNMDSENQYTYTVSAEKLGGDGEFVFSISDSAGNNSSASVIIDTIAPVLTLVSSSGNIGDLNSGLYLNNQTITITVSDATPDYIKLGNNRSNITAQDFDFVINATNQSEGDLAFVAYDKAGNSSTISITVDKTAPTLKVIKNDSTNTEMGVYLQSNDTLTFEATDRTSVICKLDGEKTDDTTFSAAGLNDGEHTYTCTDSASNTTSFTFFVDKVMPTLELIVNSEKKEDGAHFGSGTQLSFSFYESSKYVFSVDNKVYTISNNSLSLFTDALAEGIHDCLLIDAAGNESKFTFIIDKTLPVFSFNKAANEQDKTIYYMSSETIIIAVEETNLASIKLADGSKIEGFEMLASELKAGVNSITLTDLAGNFCTGSFIIDDVAPVPTLQGANTNSHIVYTEVDDIYLSMQIAFDIDCDETYLSHKTLNGKIVTYSTLPTDLAEGYYVLSFYDKAGHCSSISFVVDKTAPLLSVEKNALYTANTGEFLNADDFLNIYFSDSNIDAGSLASETIYSDTKFEASQYPEGKYTISVVDKAGNASSFLFTIDKTAPKIDITSDLYQEVDDMLYFKANSKIIITPADQNLDTQTLNGMPLTAGSHNWEGSALFEDKNTYTVCDRAGNISTLIFIVDKTSPEVVANKAPHADNGKIYYSGSDTIAFTVDDKYAFTITVGKGNKISLPVNFKASDLLEDGEYTIEIADCAKNTVLFSIVVDSVAPALSLSRQNKTAVVPGSFLANGTIYVAADDATRVSVVLNGNPLTSAIDIGALEDGEYDVEATDLAGNASWISFIVDKLQPVINVYKNNILTTAEVVYLSSSDIIKFDFYDSSFAYAYLNDSICDNIVDLETSFQISYITSDYNDGSYTFTVYDSAGNSRKAIFCIDKTPPVISIRNNDIAVADGSYFKDGSTLNFHITETNLAAVLHNDIEIINQVLLVKDLFDGKHTFTVTDFAGNESSVFFFVDKITPTLTLSSYYKPGDPVLLVPQDTNLDSISLNDELCEAGEYLADELREGTNKVVVKDKAGNILTVSFVVDLTAPLINAYKNSLPTLEKTIYLSALDTFSLNVVDANSYSVYFDYELSSVRAWSAGVLDEREYYITSVDIAGNNSAITLVVDKTAPQFNLNSYYLEGETVYIEITDETELTVLLNEQNIEDVRELDANAIGESTNTLKVTDAAGNTTAKVFVIDLTAPVMSISGYDLAGKGLTLLDGDTSYGSIEIRVSDIAASQIFYETGGFTLSTNDCPFPIKGIPENSGVWTFYALDSNGYQSKPIIINLDFQPPSYQIDGISTIQDNINYTNTSFTYSKSNPYATIFLSKNETAILETTDGSLTIDGTIANEGKYSVYVVDAFGRSSEIATVVLTVTYDFKNLTTIIDSFKQSTWYNVTLPYNIFGVSTKANIAGSYSFATFSEAETFACAMEKSYRVTTTENGKFSYPSTSNQNVIITYEDEVALDAAVYHYASRYVSSRQSFFSKEARNIYSPTPLGYTSLTANDASLPDFLSQYSDLSLYSARTTFTPTKYASPVNKSITLTYVANSVGLVEPRDISISYGKSFLEALQTASNCYEGYYIFREFDLCGNMDEALLFLDFSAPSITADIEYGQSPSQTLNLTDTVIINNNYEFYVTSFTITSLLDNVDTAYAGIYIASSSFYGIFLQGDTIPTLNSTLGAGRYSIALYDRSYNIIEFVVIVAGKEPSWHTTSLSSSNDKLSIWIYKNDTNTAFTSLKIAKILSDNTYVYLTTDAAGTPVNIANLSYVLTTGGKYTCIIDDIFGRHFEFEPIFYEKGLPTGKLTGVSKNGITKGAVTLAYADDFNLSAYTIEPSGATLPYIGPLPGYNYLTKTYTAMFDPIEGSSIHYKLVLFSIDDPGIYIEYEFIIDAKPPEFTILSSSTQIVADSSTNSPFSVDWDEDSVMCKVSRNSGIAVSYTRGTLITSNGMHVFTLTDSTYNVSTFFVFLDTEVDFSFSITPVKTDDYAYISNRSISIINKEDLVFASCKLGEVEIPYDALLIESGTYTISLEDLYQNKVTIALTLDFTPPTLTLENATSGVSNGSVSIHTEDLAATIYETSSNFNVNRLEVANGHVYSEEGVYYFKVVDIAGNYTTEKLTIDKHVAITAVAENGLVTSNAIKISYSEPVTILATLNGIEIDSSDRYTSPGQYTIVSTDQAGNEHRISFEILPSRVSTLDLKMPDGFEIVSAYLGMQSLPVTTDAIVARETGSYSITIKSTTNDATYSFTMVVDSTPPEANMTEKNGVVSFSKTTKNNVSVELYRDGVLIEGFVIPGTVDEDGNYLLVLIDDLGNRQTYEFTVDKPMNAFTIVLICLGCLGVALTIFLVIRGRFVKAA